MPRYICQSTCMLRLGMVIARKIMSPINNWAILDFTTQPTQKK